MAGPAKRMKLIVSKKYDWKAEEYYATGCKDTYGKYVLKIPEGIIRSYLFFDRVFQQFYLAKINLYIIRQVCELIKLI